MLKGKKPSSDTTPDENKNTQQFNNKPEIDVKIDAYIKNNPQHWNYIQSMPLDRLQRSVVLNTVQKLERQEKMTEGIMKKLDQNPELKQAYQTLVNNMPEAEREKMGASLASRIWRAINPREAQGAGIKV